MKLEITSTNVQLTETGLTRKPIWSINAEKWPGFPCSDGLKYKGVKRFARLCKHGHKWPCDLIHLEKAFGTKPGLYQIHHEGYTFPMFKEQPKEFEKTDGLTYLLLTEKTWHLFAIAEGQPSISGVR